MALIFWAEKADDRWIRQECEQNSGDKINSWFFEPYRDQEPI